MQKTACLLIVDDDPLFSAPIVQFLGDAGHTVRTTADIDALYATPVDADLLLLGRPRQRVSALSLLVDLRQRAETLPVIMVGQPGDLGDRIAALESGADDFVLRPVVPRELGARIQSVLRRSAPRAAPRRPVLRFAGWSLDTDSGLLSSPNGLAVQIPPRDVALLTQVLHDPSDGDARDRLMAHVDVPLETLRPDCVAPAAAPRRAIRGVATLLERCD